MPQRKPLLPNIIAHCDWSKCANKRWMTWATLGPDGGYEAEGPERVDAPRGLIPMLRDRTSPDGAILLGFDFPIGLPETYAVGADATDFLKLLPLLGETEPWDQFYEIAKTAQDIGKHRPFYPNCPGGAKQQQLVDGLGAGAFDALRRRCEKGHPERRAACPLFWTLGAQQVGRAAISGWCEVLAPALRETPGRFFVWPFNGSLQDRLQPGAVVVAETYPAEYYRHLYVRFGPRIGGKGSEEARRANAETLLTSARALRLHLSPKVDDAIQMGFGPSLGGDDGFDATVGLLGMLKVVRGELPASAPEDATVQRVEGWILGQAAKSVLS